MLAEFIPPWEIENANEQSQIFQWKLPAGDTEELIMAAEYKIEQHLI